MGSQVKMSWKKRDDTGLLWAVIVLLIGTTILIGSHGVYKGIQLDLLHEEVRELRYQLNRLQVKEDEVENEVKHHKISASWTGDDNTNDYDFNQFVGEEYQDDESYRRHRVSQTSGNDYQGHFVEIPGRLTHRGQYKTTSPPTTTTTTRRYKKPELKSLGTPDQPTKSSTAIQLEATAGGNWRLSRWAMRMSADVGFPVTNDG